MPMVTKENFREIGAAYIARHGGEGHTLTGFDMSARLWIAYYRALGMSTAVMEERLRAGRPYTVPCQRPADFDPDTRITAAHMPRPERMAADMTPAERDALVTKAVKASAMPGKPGGRYAQEDARLEQRPLPQARDLTEAEADSMRRLLGLERHQ